MPAPDAASRSAPAVSIGVVDVLQAIEQYPRWIKLKNELEDQQHAYEDQLKALVDRMEELRTTIAVLANEEERKQKEFELQMALQQQDFLRKLFRDRLQMEELRANLVIYEDLDTAIQKVAAQRGVGLVLRKHDLPPVEGPVERLSPKEVQSRVMAFERRQVWFASREIDLTGDVIKLLMVPLDAGRSTDKRNATGKEGPGAAPARRGN